MNLSCYQIITPNDLPNYRYLANDIAVASWSEFILHDPTADEYWHELFDRFEEYLVNIDWDDAILVEPNVEMVHIL